MLAISQTVFKGVRFKFSFLAPSLLPRILVRLGTYIVKKEGKFNPTMQAFSQTGASFEIGGQTGRLQLSHKDRIIDVESSDPNVLRSLAFLVRSVCSDSFYENVKVDVTVRNLHRETHMHSSFLCLPVSP